MKLKNWKPRLSLLLVLFTALPAMAEPTTDSAVWKLQTRSRLEAKEAGGAERIVYKTVAWEPRKTAIVVCDMWDKHWCRGATGRVAEMAPRINQFVKAARGRGALIVHAPSSCLDAYKDHPARRRALDAPTDGVAGYLKGWNRGLETEQGAKWPVDQSDGGCDCQPKCKSGRAWTKQIDAIEIRDEDAISDSGVEIAGLFQDRGIENVMLVGVHTNMCVIGRPFGLRNMVRLGRNVVLVRDLTDTMYNSQQRPQVSHVRGTELVVDYIERYVCPTITSSSLLDGPAQRFAEDRRPHVAIIVSDNHYHADQTLPQFADDLRGRYGCYCTVIHGEGTNRFPAMEQLETADVAVLYVRRLAPPKQQLDQLRAFLDAGKPLVALRTASHAFDVRGESPAGCDQWPKFDADVLGGNYRGHEADKLGTDVAIVPERADHPALSGVKPNRWHSTGSLYRTSPISADATLLMTGSIAGKTEPLTWTPKYKQARVLYTSLGHPDDFEQAAFRRLLTNAIFWAMDKPAAGNGHTAL